MDHTVFSWHELPILFVFAYIHIQYVWMLERIIMQFKGSAYKEIR